MQGIIRKNKTIISEFGAGDTDWKILIEPEATQLNSDVAAYFSSHIVSLFARVNLKSVTAVSIPEIPPDASELERLAIVKEYEWGGPRFHLEYGIKEGGADWIPIWETALLNQAGSPGYTINCMNVLGASGDFILGETAQLGARIINAGWGDLAGADKVVVYGGAIQEAWQIPSLLNIVNQAQETRLILAAGQTHIIPANPHRRGLLISNWEPGEVSISEGGLSGFPLIGQGAAYEITSSRLWRGEIVVTAITDSEIEIVEYT